MSPQLALHASACAALSLMHTLWQAAACALLLKLVTATAGRQWGPAIRYRAGVLCLTIIVAAPLLGFAINMWPTANQASALPAPAYSHTPFTMAAAGTQIAVGQPSIAPILERVQGWVQAHATPIVALWLLGCALFALRLVLARAGLQRLLRLSLPAAHPLHTTLEARIKQLAVSAGLRAAPTLKVVTAGTGPFIFGVWHTVLAVPASLAGGISPELMDALLMHELAHIRRSDPLVNALQCVAETVLFYHPAVWWVSAQLRRERELCCDDCVLEALPNRALYANALLAAAQLQSSPAVLAAADAKRGLIHRIERILGMNPNKLQGRTRTAPTAAVGLALIAASAAAAIFMLPTASSAHQSAAVVGKTTFTQPNDGIRVVLTDSKLPARNGRQPAALLVHDHDLQEVVKALKSTAVGQVEVNGIPVKNPATIKAHGPDIEVDGRQILPPYTVIARGNPVKLFDALKLGGDITLKQMHDTDPTMVTVTRLPRGQAVGTMIRVAPAPRQSAGKEGKQSWDIRVKLLQASPAAPGELKTISSPRIMTLMGMPAQIQIGSKGADGKEISGTDLSITVTSADASHATIKGRLRVHLEGKAENSADIPQNTVVPLDKPMRVIGVTTSQDQAAIKAALSGKLPADPEATTTIAEITVVRHQ